MNERVDEWEGRRMNEMTNRNTDQWKPAIAVSIVYNPNLALLYSALLVSYIPTALLYLKIEINK